LELLDSVGAYEISRDRAGAPRRLVGFRQVPGGSGYGSMDSKVVHFGGTDPGAHYDLVIRMPAAREKVLSALRPPLRTTVTLEAEGPSALRGSAGYRAAHFLASTNRLDVRIVLPVRPKRLCGIEDSLRDDRLASVRDDDLVDLGVSLAASELMPGSGSGALSGDAEELGVGPAIPIDRCPRARRAG